MTLNRQDGLAVQVRASAETFLRTHCPQLRNSLPEAPFAVAPEAGELAGYLLAGTAALAFCCELLGLAVSSPFDVAVPRWLILAYGVGCALLAVLAPLLSRPAQQLKPSAEQGHGDGKDVKVDRWAATLDRDAEAGRWTASRRTARLDLAG
jgi:hypothetical protein